MQNLLKNIEIKDFKCFKDFKADGFKRVNLIGGKNNVGKTAFMEVCYLGITTQKCCEDKIPNRLMDTVTFFNALIAIELSRNPSSEFEIVKDSNAFDFKYDKSILRINEKICSISDLDDCLYDKPMPDYKVGINKILQFYKGDNNPLDIKNNTFISVNGIRQNYISDCIDDIKLLNKWDVVNKQLQDIFNIQKIDVIKNTVMLEYEKNYLKLYEFGDGLKHFISIIISINLNENAIVFLDEVDNGIHYSNFDKLWEIILTISKKQNVQVFATTHSKECIESYARVSKKLEDEDITFIELGKDENKIESITYNYKEVINQVSQHQDMRGW